MYNSRLEQKITRGFQWTLMLGGLGFASFCICRGVNRRNAEEAKAKAYIQARAPEKYNELVQKDGMPRTFNWLEEAQKVETAMKIDSIAKTNYALGMQAIRDSIANAREEK